jgi:hypothetical protein
MTATRRWFRVWFRHEDDPLRSEDTLLVQATDEHAIHKQMAHERKRVTACYAQYPDAPEEATP